LRKKLARGTSYITTTNFAIDRIVISGRIKRGGHGEVNLEKTRGEGDSTLK